jgi:hypothetical protein
MPNVDEYNQVVGADTPAPPPPPSPTLGGGDTYLDRLVGLGISPEQEKALTKGLAKDKEEEIEARKGITDEMNRGISEWEHVGEHAYKATQASMAAIPPKWDANAESAKYATNPIMAFGSAASVFGILAASFTHAPMMNALNASAAAMNAYAKGDQEAYNRAHDAWKENTDLAIKRHDMMEEAYKDAMQMMKTKPEIARVRLEALATQYQDKATLTMLQNGLDPQLDELRSKRALVAQQVSQAALGMMKIDAVKQLDDAYRSGDQEKVKAAEQHKKDVQELFSPSLGRTGSPVEQMKAAALQAWKDADLAGDEGGKAQAEAVLNKIGESQHPGAYRAKPGSEGAYISNPERRKEYAAKYPDASARELDRIITRDYIADRQKKPMLKAGSQEEFMEVRKRELLENNALQRREAEEARTRGEDVANIPRMTEGDAHLLAFQQWQTAKKINPAPSNPAAERSEAQYVFNGQLPPPSWFYLRTHPDFSKTMEAIEKENGRPFDPTLYARNMAAARVEAAAGPRADSEALKNIVATQAATKAFGDFVALHGDQLVQLAEKVGLDRTTAIEKYILQGRQALGDEDVSAFKFMLETFVTDTARIIQNPRLTGQLTDTAKREIKEAMPAAPNVQTLREILERVRKDVVLRDKTLNDEANVLRKNLHLEPREGPQPQPGTMPGANAIDDELRRRGVLQ